MAPSHYLNQCWNIVNWTHRNKLQWNLNRNIYFFIQENAFENVVWKMEAILSPPQCVKGFIDDTSTVAEAMAWCYQAMSHNLNQCWPSSMMLYCTTRGQCLTHWGWDKMATILQTTLWNAFSSIKKFKFRLKFHWIDSMPTLIQIITWRWTDNKLLSEPVMG